MLYTSCILAPRKPEDGLRISVMSRHTENDGITPDLRITQDLFDIHLSILAPSSGLVGSYYKLSLPWIEFEKKYREEIRDLQKTAIVRLIASMAMSRPLTLLCIEEKAVRCHRRLLAEECKRFERKLKIIHR